MRCRILVLIFALGFEAWAHDPAAIQRVLPKLPSHFACEALSEEIKPQDILVQSIEARRVFAEIRQEMASLSVRCSVFERDRPTKKNDECYYIPVLNVEDEYSGSGRSAEEQFAIVRRHAARLTGELTDLETKLQHPLHAKLERRVVYSRSGKESIRSFLKQVDTRMRKSQRVGKFFRPAEFWIGFLCATGGLGMMLWTRDLAYLLASAVGASMAIHANHSAGAITHPVSAFFLEVEHNLDPTSTPRLMTMGMRNTNSGDFLYVRSRIDEKYFLELIYSGLSTEPKLLVYLSPAGADDT